VSLLASSEIAPAAESAIRGPKETTKNWNYMWAASLCWWCQFSMQNIIYSIRRSQYFLYIGTTAVSIWRFAVIMCIYTTVISYWFHHVFVRY